MALFKGKDKNTATGMIVSVEQMHSYNVRSGFSDHRYGNDLEMIMLVEFDTADGKHVTARTVQSVAEINLPKCQAGSTVTLTYETKNPQKIEVENLREMKQTILDPTMTGNEMMNAYSSSMETDKNGNPKLNRAELRAQMKVLMDKGLSMKEAMAQIHDITPEEATDAQNGDVHREH